MFRLFTGFLVGLASLFFATNSIGFLSAEDAVQKRIEMFKLAGANIKKLSKLIRSSDISASVELVNFHVGWSEEMLRLFPIGSEASTSNNSDASSDIWRDTMGFEEQVRQYNLSSIELTEALKREDIDVIRENFEELAKSCKSCHKRFRN